MLFCLFVCCYNFENFLLWLLWEQLVLKNTVYFEFRTSELNWKSNFNTKMKICQHLLIDLKRFLLWINRTKKKRLIYFEIWLILVLSETNCLRNMFFIMTLILTISSKSRYIFQKMSSMIKVLLTKVFLWKVFDRMKVQWMTAKYQQVHSLFNNLLIGRFNLKKIHKIHWNERFH